MHLIYTMYANIFINKSTEVYYLSILIHPVCTATEFNLEQNKSKKLQHKGITLSNAQQANKADIFKRKLLPAHMLPYHKILSLNNCCIIILLECCYPSARCLSPDRRSLQATSLYLPCVRQEKENCKLEVIPAVVKRKRGWVGEEEGVHWPQKFREWWQTSQLRHHSLTIGCCTSRLLKQFVKGLLISNAWQAF